MDVLAGDCDLLHCVVATLGQLVQDGAHQILGRRGAGGEADDPVLVEEPVVQVALPVDERGRRPGSPRHLDEPVGVGARGRADDENQGRTPTRDLLDGVLPVLGRVADVVGRRPAQPAEALLEIGRASCRERV